MTSFGCHSNAINNIDRAFKETYDGVGHLCPNLAEIFYPL